MMPQRSEPLLLIPGGSLPYPPQRMLQVCPALGPEPSLPSRIALGRSPSLRPLRPWPVAMLVREHPRYYGTVRLPVPVHRCLAPSGFATRTWLPWPGQTRDLPVPAREASLRAGGLRPRGARRRSRDNDRGSVAFWIFDTIGAPNYRTKLRGSMARPARSPVNASKTRLPSS